jgi:hypothetical protein
VAGFKNWLFGRAALLKLQNGSHDVCPVTRVDSISIALIKTSYG